MRHAVRTATPFAVSAVAYGLRKTKLRIDIAEPFIASRHSSTLTGLTNTRTQVLTSSLDWAFALKSDTMLFTSVVFKPAISPSVAASVVGSVTQDVAALAFVTAVLELTRPGVESNSANRGNSDVGRPARPSEEGLAARHRHEASKRRGKNSAGERQEPAQRL
jgi:hypothetical protein